MSRRFGTDVSSKLPDPILVRAVFCGLSFLAIASTVEGASETVNLTAIDGSYYLQGREGGIYYVVPVSKSITLSCNASLSRYISSLTLHWNVTVGNYSSSRGITDYALDKNQKFSRIPSNEHDVLQNNPSFVRVHNLQISDNDSIILCGVPSQEVENTLVVTSTPIHILVEGLPQCPGKISAMEKDSGYVVTWEEYRGLFPPMYTVLINSTTGSIKESTGNNQYELSSADVVILTNGTNASANFLISVSTCTEAGCSENCHYSIISPSPGNSTNGTNPDDISDQSPLLSRTVIIVIAVVAAVGLLTVFICALVCLLICIAKKRRSGTKTPPPSGEEIAESFNKACFAGIPEYDTVADVIFECTDSPAALQQQLLKSDGNSIAHTPVVDAGYRNVTNSASSRAPRKVRHQKRKPKRTVESNAPLYAEVLVNTQQQRPCEYSQPIRVFSASPPLPSCPPPKTPPPLPSSPAPKTPPTLSSASQPPVSVPSSNSHAVTDRNSTSLSDSSNQPYRSTRTGIEE